MAAPEQREDWEFVSWVTGSDRTGRQSAASVAEQVPNSDLVPEGKRACPICGKTMLSSRQYGVLIDVCEAHGLWLDKGELAEVVGQIKSADIRVHVQRMEREAEKLKQVMQLMTEILQRSHP